MRGYIIASSEGDLSEKQSKASPEISVSVSQSVEKYFDLDGNRSLLQQNIQVGVESEEEIKASEKITSIAPTIQSELPISAEIMLDGKMIETAYYSYNKQTGNLQIELENNNKNSSYKVIYVYEDIDTTVAQEIQLNTSAEIKTQNNVTAFGKNEQTMQITAIGEKISIKNNATEQIYKGYMYQGTGKETAFKENHIIEVSNIEADKIEITTEKEVYAQYEEVSGKQQKTQEFATNNGIYYKRTVINKEKMLEILGTNGIIQIKNGDTDIVPQITKDTVTNESGDIVIEYSGTDVKKVEIITSKPAKIGVFEIKHEKAILANTGYTKDGLKTFDYLEETIKLNNSTIETNIALVEPKLEAEIETTQKTLSTMSENKEVEFKVILKSSAESSRLYNSPKVQIILPEEVEKIELLDKENLLNEKNLFFEDELKIDDVTVEGKTINIIFSGIQTSYKEDSIEGAVVTLKANLTLNKRAISSEKEIALKCTNADNETVETNQKVSIVSPREMITINKIEALNIQTYGNDKEFYNKLSLGEAEKEITVVNEIISNNENEVQNVKILGDMPSNNNLGATIKTPLTVEKTDGKTATVYYSADENDTEDLTDTENEWTTSTENIVNAKKYLVIIDSMAKGETVKISYNATIPANLEYEQKALEGYSVLYKDTIEKTIDSTYINLTTGEGPVVEGTISATIGGKTVESGSKVKIGEVIRYRLNVKNIGTEKASNIAVEANIPEGTVYVVPEEGYEYTSISKKGEVTDEEADAEGWVDTRESEDYGENDGDVYYEEKEDITTYNTTIEGLEPGEERKIEYEVRVKYNAVIGSDIKTLGKVKYEEVEKETNEFINQVENANLRVTFKRVTDKSINIDNNEFVTYFAVINNISDEEQKNVKLKIENSEYTEIARIQDFYMKEREVTDVVDIGTLGKGKSYLLTIVLRVKNFEENSLQMVNSVKVIDSNDNEYRSNIYVDKIHGVNLSFSMAANNENEYMKPGDKIEYVINVKNNNAEAAAEAIRVTSQVPTELTVLSVKVNGVEQKFTDEIVGEDAEQGMTIEDLENMQEDISENKVIENDIFLTGSIEANGVMEIKIETVVNYSPTRTEDVKITNLAKLISKDIEYAEASVSHMLQKIEPDDPNHPDNIEIPNNPDTPDNPNHPDNPGENEEIEYLYAIRGIAWKDSDKDGKLQDNEEKISGMNVKLLNIETNELLKNKENEVIVSITDGEGNYVFQTVPRGRYIVVFEYDAENYIITANKKVGVDESRNSKVVSKKMNIEGTEKLYAVSDTIQIIDTSISNINIGLVKMPELNLKLDKYIRRVIIQTPNYTNVYSYTDAKLAKVEFDAKKVKNAEITVEYGITVTNISEIAGYAKKIVDYLPEGFEFNSNINKGWYKDGNGLTNVSLTNEKINEGESKTIILTVTKSINTENTGTYTNNAEIVQMTNEFGTNKNIYDKDDKSSADIIVSIKTGKVHLYIMLTISLVMIIAVGIYVIKKRVIDIKF